MTQILTLRLAERSPAVHSASEARHAARGTAEVIVFPRMGLAHLRGIWEAMQRSSPCRDDPDTGAGATTDLLHP